VRIILQKEVEKLGVPGDVVNVADGYARNFLVPRGLAIQATKGTVRQAENLRRAHEERTAKARKEAEALADRLGAVTVRLVHRAGGEGKLFGSITAQDLAAEIEKQSGQPVDRRSIMLEEPIRSVGSHEVQIHLVPDVTARVTVEVEPEA